MTSQQLKQRIMITRPASQATGLAQSIESAGANVFLFPTLNILPAKLSEENRVTIQQLNQFNIIIFISPNAVEHGLNHIQVNTKTIIATIGQGSAKALTTKLGRKPDITPEENFSSEGLLATDEMQDVANKRILIIRGNGGRELLKRTLEQRGAIVEYFTAYERTKPTTNTADLEQYLQNNQIAAIVITSAESLKNLVEITPKSVISNLLETPLLLINSRLINVAKDIGFNSKLLVTNEATDSAIVDTLKEHNLLELIKS